MMATVLAFVLIAANPATLATPGPATELGIAPLVWVLVSLPDGGALTHQGDDAGSYTLQFLPDGSIAVDVNGDHLAGNYTIAGDRLDLTLDRCSQTVCAPGSLAAALLSSLASATSFAYEPDGGLTLHTEAGALRFRPTLSGVVWQWHDFRGGNDAVVAPTNPERYTIEFLPENRVAIRADCNRAKGSYAIDGASIDVTITGVTRAFCRGGSLSNDFLRDLDAATSHLFRNGNLYLVLPIDAGVLSLEPRYRLPALATPESS